MNRRELLTRTASLMLAAPFVYGWTPRFQARKSRILMFTKSSGYQHAMIKREGGKLGPAEQILTDLGAKHGFEVICSKDGGVFTPQNIAQYDAFFFYTSGDLTKPGTDMNPPMTLEGKAAFLDAIKAGKGFIGTHSASDTFHTQPDPPDRSNRYLNHGEKADPYVRMLGGEFIKHGPQQVARMKVVDSGFPGFKGAGESFELMEEWYSIKDFSPDLHVLLVQQTKGMTGADYQRAPYPAAWARMHGKGRVFYTSMGHRDDVWANPLFQNILLGGISWALRNVDADITPNLESAAPNHREIPPKGK